MNSKPIPAAMLSVIALIFSILSFVPHHSCSATSFADTMLAGQSLTGNRTLVSKGGKFELGFFTPGNSQKYYIGIWFKQVASVQKKKTVVWVANRNKPISTTDLSSSEFKLLEDGQLVLFFMRAMNNYSSEVPIWSANSTTLKRVIDSSIKVVLHDNGNLAVLSSSNGNIMWQSFDHPTNSVLPGAKLGYNNITNTGQILTSWRNSEDPSEGFYSVKVEPDGSISFIWNRLHKFYNSGVWNGHYLSNFPEMQSGLQFSYDHRTYANGSYFIYSVSDETPPLHIFIDVSGQLKTTIWQSNTQDWIVIWTKPMPLCQVYGICGALSICNDNNIGPSICQCLPGFENHNPKDWDLLDYSSGCVRNTSLWCGDKDDFQVMPNTDFSQIITSANVLVIDDAKKCKSTCLQNCSCNAYAYHTTGGNNKNIRCLLWYGSIVNLRQVVGDTGVDLYIRLAASEDHLLGSRKKFSTIAIVGAVLSGLTIFGGVALVFLQKHLKRRSSETQELDEGYAFLTAFRSKDLKIATKNFSDKLGSGGFGSVFKGTLPDMTVVAVKKLERVTQEQKQFRSEISTIGLIHHVNLVRLRGFCSEGAKQMLVYDFMPNGSLDRYLFRRNNSKILNWPQRYQIAIGTARGVAYLHEECRDCIIHCDIKPENILLDVDFHPKVADFGLAKLLGHEFSRVVTSMRGTVGYLAPEWTSGVAITAKVDVYSYGMMLFELISGRRNLKQANDGRVWFFPTWAAKRVGSEGHSVLSILDDNLDGNANIEELNRAFKVACWCIQENETERPSMGQVVQILEGLLDVNRPPINRHLHALMQSEESTSFFSKRYLQSNTPWL